MPVCTYEDLRPAIEVQEKSREPLLTSGQPILFAQTSGTTGVPKNIPILPQTVEAIRRFRACVPMRNGRECRPSTKVACW